ncbi:MAG TPA: amino acid ABC transporter permease [Nocardioidaceae bacterium]|nr:amino acid ABC transporter permease [Nocardioidaceae bacterium]
MSERAPSDGGIAPEDIRAVPARHPRRWVATIVILYIVAGIIHFVATSPNFQWGIFHQFFVFNSIIRGLGQTVLLTIVSMAIGIVLGIILAVMRLSPAPIVSGVAWIYIWLFRGTPLLVQIIFWFNVQALIGQNATVTLPFTGLALFHVNANQLIAGFTAGILALGLNEGAYMAEIVRAGFLSVDEGQTEAAASLGMSRLQTIRFIVLPQAMRVIVPPTGNETISMLKNSSLLSVVGYTELLYSAQLIYSVNYKVIPLLIVASVWYLVLTSVLTLGQFYVERYYARGSSRQLPPTPLQRLRAMWVRNLTAFHATPPEVPTPPTGPNR